jgi:hypothetical protein
MPGPIDSLRFVHTALVREITDLDRLVADARTAEQAAVLGDRFAFLEKLSEGHTQGEEIGLFPDLDAKIPSLSKTYLFDHVDERAAFARIRASIDACRKGDAAALTPLAVRLRGSPITWRVTSAKRTSSSSRSSTSTSAWRSRPAWWVAS